jgi:predicted Holliday junction resolvase-like endonuclease
MEKMISVFLQNPAEGILLVGMLVLIVCTIVQIHKIRKLNKKIETIVKSVEAYLTAIMEDEEKTDEKLQVKTEAVKIPAKAYEQEEKQTKQTKQEEQSRLISAVLQEIFP